MAVDVRAWSAGPDPRKWRANSKAMPGAREATGADIVKEAKGPVRTGGARPGGPGSASVAPGAGPVLVERKVVEATKSKASGGSGIMGSIKKWLSDRKQAKIEKVRAAVETQQKIADSAAANAKQESLQKKQVIDNELAKLKAKMGQAAKPQQPAQAKPPQPPKPQKAVQPEKPPKSTKPGFDPKAKERAALAEKIIATEKAQAAAKKAKAEKAIELKEGDFEEVKPKVAAKPPKTPQQRAKDEADIAKQEKAKIDTAIKAKKAASDAKIEDDATKSALEELKKGREERAAKKAKEEKPAEEEKAGKEVKAAIKKAEAKMATPPKPKGLPAPSAAIKVKTPEEMAAKKEADKKAGEALSNKAKDAKMEDEKAAKAKKLAETTKAPETQAKMPVKKAGLSVAEQSHPGDVKAAAKAKPTLDDEDAATHKKLIAEREKEIVAKAKATDSKSVVGGLKKNLAQRKAGLDRKLAQLKQEVYNETNPEKKQRRMSALGKAFAGAGRKKEGAEPEKKPEYRGKQGGTFHYTDTGKKDYSAQA